VGQTSRVAHLFVTLAQISTHDVPACVLIEPPQDRNPAAFEDRPDYPKGSLVIRAKPSWSAQEDDLVTQFSMMGFNQVARHPISPALSVHKTFSGPTPRAEPSPD